MLWVKFSVALLQKFCLCKHCSLPNQTIPPPACCFQGYPNPTREHGVWGRGEMKRHAKWILPVEFVLKFFSLNNIQNWCTAETMDYYSHYYTWFMSCPAFRRSSGWQTQQWLNIRKQQQYELQWSRIKYGHEHTHTHKRIEVCKKFKQMKRWTLKVDGI